MRLFERAYCRSLTLAATLVLVLLFGCDPAPAPPPTRGSWVGTITTEGGLTTVVNESGSVWGAPATLAEEASIGVAEGDDEYLFGAIYALHATSRAIYVVDGTTPAVRIYDHAGSYLRDIGRPGQGPGEYEFPSLLTTDTDGRIYVLDGRLNRISVFSTEGESLEEWPIRTSRCCVWPMFAFDRGTLWVPVRELLEETRNYRNGAQAVGPAGPQGDVTWVPDVDYERVTFSLNGVEMETPFGPRVAWNLTPEGGVVFGASDRYRFEMHRGDGRRLVVERYWDPVPAPAGHRDWHRQYRVAGERRRNAEWAWDGAEIPHHKPAFASLTPALSGEIWLTREGPSRQIAECAGDPIDVGLAAAASKPCWTSELMVDVFGEDGRYLGEVQVPHGVRPFHPSLVVDGSVVVVAAEDDAGTPMVKRYRLELPEGTGR